MNRFLTAGVFVLVGICVVGCSAAPKPTDAEVHAARQANMYTRQIDKSHAVADEASKRADDAALH